MNNLYARPQYAKQLEIKISIIISEIKDNIRNTKPQQAVTKENQLETLALENIMGEVNKFSRRMQERNGRRDADSRTRGEAEAACLCTRLQRVHTCAYMNVYNWI